MWYDNNGNIISVDEIVDSCGTLTKIKELDILLQGILDRGENIPTDDELNIENKAIKNLSNEILKKSDSCQKKISKNKATLDKEIEAIIASIATATEKMNELKDEEKKLNEEKENIDEDIKTNGKNISDIEYDISQLKVKISELNKNILIKEGNIMEAAKDRGEEYAKYTKKGIEKRFHEDIYKIANSGFNMHVGELDDYDVSKDTAINGFKDIKNQANDCINAYNDLFDKAKTLEITLDNDESQAIKDDINILTNILNMVKPMIDYVNNQNNINVIRKYVHDNLESLKSQRDKLNENENKIMRIVLEDLELIKAQFATAEGDYKYTDEDKSKMEKEMDELINEKQEKETDIMNYEKNKAEYETIISNLRESKKQITTKLHINRDEQVSVFGNITLSKDQLKSYTDMWTNYEVASIEIATGLTNIQNKLKEAEELQTRLQYARNNQNYENIIDKMKKAIDKLLNNEDMKHNNTKTTIITGSVAVILLVVSLIILIIYGYKLHNLNKAGEDIRTKTSPIVAVILSSVGLLSSLVLGGFTSLMIAKN